MSVSGQTGKSKASASANVSAQGEAAGGDKAMATCRCSLRVKEDDKGAGCSKCGQWFHIKCEGLSNEQYKLMSKVESKFLHWFCGDCEIDTLSTGKVIHALKMRQQQFEKEMSEMKDEVKGIKDDVSKQLKDIRQELNSVKQQMQHAEEVKALIELKLDEFDVNLGEKYKVDEPNWAEVVKLQVDTTFNKVTHNINEVQKVVEETRQKAQEEREKENRANNIIIFRVPELENKDNRIKEDKEFCQALISDVLQIDLGEDDFKRLFRVGKKEEGKSRPILLQFRDRIVKNRVMESLYKLKDAENKFKNISVVHDMTKQERGECKKMVGEAKKKQEEEKGEFLWRVRGPPGQMKLLRIQKR